MENKLIEELLELHKPWIYTLKKLGDLEFCNHCKDATGRIYVTYPCPTARIAMRYKGDTNAS